MKHLEGGIQIADSQLEVLKCPKNSISCAQTCIKTFCNGTRISSGSWQCGMKREVGK